MSKKRFHIKKIDADEKDLQIFKIYHAVDAIKKAQTETIHSIEVSVQAFPEAIQFHCTSDKAMTLILKITMMGEGNVFLKTIQLYAGQNNFMLPYMLTRNSHDFIVDLIGQQNNLLFHREFAAAS